MKKLIFSILFAFSVVSFANAQSNAIGARLGAGIGSGTEASLLLGINNNNRVEFTLGLDYTPAFNATAVYQWVFDLSQLEPGFNWYTGVGLGILVYGENTITKRDQGANVGILGILGLEYNFDFPLQLSLDFRPGIYLGSKYRSGFGPGFAVGARYRF